MSYLGLAGRCGISKSAMQDLTEGNIVEDICLKLGLTNRSIKSFVDGGTSKELAGKIGIRASTLQEIRNEKGYDGAVQLIIALLLKENSSSLQ